MTNEQERKEIPKEERERAIRQAIPLQSLGYIETQTRTQAILVVRPVQTGDLWSFSGHPLDLIQSLRRTADALEQRYAR